MWLRLVGALLALGALGCQARLPLVGTWESETVASQMGLEGMQRTRWRFQPDGRAQQHTELTMPGLRSERQMVLREGTWRLAGGRLEVAVTRVVLDGPGSLHKELKPPLPPALRAFQGTLRLEQETLILESEPGKRATFRRAP